MSGVIEEKASLPFLGLFMYAFLALISCNMLVEAIRVVL